MSAPDPPERVTSTPSFWDARYVLDGPGGVWAFGDGPDPFIAEATVDLEAHGAIGIPSRVVDLGAGEGRHAVWAAGRGHHTVAVDFAEAGLEKARALAEAHDVEIEAVAADVRAWQPAEPCDVVLLAFVHLLPEVRADLFERLPDVLRPGGWLVARWFRPEHARRSTFGPSKPDRLVTERDVRQGLQGGHLHRCEARAVTLAQGRFLQGGADVLDVVWQAPH